MVTALIGQNAASHGRKISHRGLLPSALLLLNWRWTKPLRGSGINGHLVRCGLGLIRNDQISCLPYHLVIFWRKDFDQCFLETTAEVPQCDSLCLVANPQLLLVVKVCQ